VKKFLKDEKMDSITFVNVVIENFSYFLFWLIFFYVLLFFAVKKIAIGGIFDPIHFFYTFTFGTKYAIVCFLYFLGYISNYLFFIILLFGVSFYLSLIFFSKMKPIFMKQIFSLVIPRVNTSFLFKIIIIVYIFIFIYVVSKIGFRLFASTNRYDISSGYGVFVRINIVLGLFIIAYLSSICCKRWYILKKNDLKQYICYIILFMFIIFYILFDGAKASLFYVFMIIILSIKINRFNFKISFWKGMIILFVATFFAVSALYINLSKNGIDPLQKGKIIKNVPIVVENFVNRILSNGDQTYMSLPNNVIDKIKKDSVIIRFLTPIIGISHMSKIVGYRANDLTVGRQILLYYSQVDVSTGPVSHFDLFAYVYFGIGGVVFVIFIGWILGSLNKLLRESYSKSIFYKSLIIICWVRAGNIILEPPTGFAYLFDIIIIFFLLNVINFMISTSLNKKGNIHAKSGYYCSNL
jgi:hypothetical protein